ncbi:hypothetical protein C922_05313 [Plasmodium inui San Antonio 1]|uniref:Plasmodium RESA N-terminal domain-containing protein n=1 Tax=Plasmodium inui San Antonio 1 TaxID=1237626 RepID=W6ZY95_9APIC|nr:hypothetical protein C922_05313 [Plasmodium inui San Antonio 1]EUD64298.1 hypothetical protein C922_05313 [Plasmodium inui San Antonio 1]
MNIVMLVLNIVALVLVLWQSLCSYDFQCHVSRPSHGCKQTGKRADRILEAEHMSALEENGQLFGEQDEEMENHVTLILNYPMINAEHEELYTDEQNDLDEIEFHNLINRVNILWNEAVENMIKEYVTYTDNHHMEIPWRNEMWTQAWDKYLESIHADLNKFLNDDSLSLQTRENIANNLLYSVNDDFKWFLDIVKEEWDKEMANRSGVVITEV